MTVSVVETKKKNESEHRLGNEGRKTRSMKKLKNAPKAEVTGDMLSNDSKP